eukprot:scaffold32213_cov58-Phaeocystis_antarctica.AAC.3
MYTAQVPNYIPTNAVCQKAEKHRSNRAPRTPSAALPAPWWSPTRGPHAPANLADPLPNSLFVASLRFFVSLRSFDINLTLFPRFPLDNKVCSSSGRIAEEDERPSSQPNSRLAVRAASYCVTSHPE